jgi:hypothetical protein
MRVIFKNIRKPSLAEDLIKIREKYLNLFE